MTSYDMIHSNPNDHDPSWDYGQTWPEGNCHDHHYMIKDPDPDKNHVSDQLS